MEKYYLHTIGIPVVAEHGDRVGNVGDVIVNPETGKIAGFFMAPVGRKVIVPIDIITWSNFIKIHDLHDIVDIDEIHQISTILSKKIPLYKNKVITKSGDYIGKVIDYGMDTKFFALNCLVVGKSFLGLIFWNRKIIAAADIIEITKKNIIVKDLVQPVKMKKLVLSPLSPPR